VILSVPLAMPRPPPPPTDPKVIGTSNKGQKREREVPHKTSHKKHKKHKALDSSSGSDDEELKRPVVKKHIRSQLFAAAAKAARSYTGPIVPPTTSPSK